MFRVISFVLIAGAASLAPAIAQQRSPQDAAKEFSLDPATLSGDPTPAPADTTTDSPRGTVATSADTPIVATLGARPSLDTPIAQLIANPRAKAVLDKDLPGLSSDENLAKFDQLSLRRFQPLTGGQLTRAMLDKVGADLAALGAGGVEAFTPALPSTRQRRGKQDDGR